MVFSRNLFVIAAAFCFSLAQAYRHPPNPTGFPEQEATLAAHNNARAAVGVGPMVWNDTVADYAQNYAQVRIGDCAMQHSQGPYGENLAAGWGKMSGPDAVAFWMTEKKDYDYSSNQCHGEACGHYTQIVWRDSVQLGCGTVKCETGMIFVTCNYDPPGNYEGERPY